MREENSGGEMQGKNVLILGASGDIGAEIARELAASGYTLLLHYHQNKSSVEKIIQQLDETAILQVIQADLTSDEACKKFLHEIAYAVHAVIIVSGRAQFGLFQDIAEVEMDKMISLHVKSPFLIVQHLLPEMIGRQAGNIIFITSKWGMEGSSNEVIYSAVKGAQNSFVKALAKEVGPSGIQVNAISPGFIDTKMNEHLQDKERDEILARIPMNRAGSPSDVAHMVQFLMDEKASYIQGEIISITGGW